MSIEGWLMIGQAPPTPPNSRGCMNCQGTGYFAIKYLGWQPCMECNDPAKFPPPLPIPIPDDADDDCFDDDD